MKIKPIAYNKRIHTATKSACLRSHVRPSLRLYQRGSHWADFRKIWYLGLLSKCVEIIKVFKVGPKCRVHYMKTLECFIVADVDIKSP
jgi:hypothetical protein